MTTIEVDSNNETKIFLQGSSATNSFSLVYSTVKGEYNITLIY